VNDTSKPKAHTWRAQIWIMLALALVMMARAAAALLGLDHFTWGAVVLHAVTLVVSIGCFGCFAAAWWVWALGDGRQYHYPLRDDAGAMRRALERGRQSRPSHRSLPNSASERSRRRTGRSFSTGKPRSTSSTRFPLSFTGTLLAEPT
jgi:hypothetical protein